MRTYPSSPGRFAAIVLLAAFLLCSCSEDDPITGPDPEPSPGTGWRAWSHPDGTTHWYRAVSAPAGITWEAAYDSAVAAAGLALAGPANFLPTKSNISALGLILSTDFIWKRNVS